MCYSIKGTTQQNTIFTFFTEGARAHWPLHFLHHLFFDAGATFTLSHFLHHVFFFFFSWCWGSFTQLIFYTIYFPLGVGALSPSLFFTPKMLGHFHPPNFLHLFFYKHTNNYLTMKVKNTGHGVNNIMFLFI